MKSIYFAIGLLLFRIADIQGDVITNNATAILKNSPNDALGVITVNWQDCRKVCQLVTNCYAFTWISSNHVCFLKHLTGWTSVHRPGMYSSFQQDNFPIMKDTDFSGADLGCF